MIHIFAGVIFHLRKTIYYLYSKTIFFNLFWPFWRGIREDREPNFAHNLPPPLPSRAEHGDGETPEPVGPTNINEKNKTSRKFDGKKVYIISARVHPGETPASHVLRGMVDFILRTNDKRSKQLRNDYIFKVFQIYFQHINTIPMSKIINLYFFS